MAAIGIAHMPSRYPRLRRAKLMTPFSLRRPMGSRQGNAPQPEEERKMALQEAGE